MRELLTALVNNYSSRAEMAELLFDLTSKITEEEIYQVGFILRGWCDAFQVMDGHISAQRVMDLRSDWVQHLREPSASAESS